MSHREDFPKMSSSHRLNFLFPSSPFSSSFPLASFSPCLLLYYLLLFPTLSSFSFSHPTFPKHLIFLCFPSQHSSFPFCLFIIINVSLCFLVFSSRFLPCYLILASFPFPIPIFPISFSPLVEILPCFLHISPTFLLSLLSSFSRCVLLSYPNFPNVPSRLLTFYLLFFPTHPPLLSFSHTSFSNLL